MFSFKWLFSPDELLYSCEFYSYFCTRVSIAWLSAYGIFYY